MKIENSLSFLQKIDFSLFFGTQVYIASYYSQRQPEVVGR